ncbi:MAG: TMEM165/GDT1 family protein [Neisseria sp.]|nr:TMEM165/GDT1 family protein [Neisseria sp.]
MDAFWYSTLGVFIAEMGDKTQLLTLFLAARFASQKNAIILGIFVATLLNHAVSAFFGVWLTENVSPEVMKWIVGVSFLLVGLWLLIPDKDDDNSQSKWLKHGAFAAATVLFFLAEIGDKTQIATILLAAKYHSLSAVIGGSIAGLMLANVPLVYLGEKMMQKIPAITMRVIACAIFYILGFTTLLGSGIRL